MYLLIACASSWLLLLGSFCTVWVRLPQPWATTDMVIIAIIGAAALLFARLGLISALALLLRILPSGRLRTRLMRLIVRAMPKLLAASVLTIASASLVSPSAQATPAGTSGPAPTSAAESAQAPLDPGWPTVDDDDLPNPGWPTEPPPETAPSSPPDDPQQDGTADPPDGPETSAYVVAPGDSLWSIAAEHTEENSDIPRHVADLYAANEDVIGPDPSLILAGQRLEIQT